MVEVGSNSSNLDRRRQANLLRYMADVKESGLPIEAALRRDISSILGVDFLEVDLRSFLGDPNSQIEDTPLLPPPSTQRIKVSNTITVETPIGQLRYKINERLVTSPRAPQDSDDIRLTPIEGRVLLTLTRNPGEAVSRTKMGVEVWGYTEEANLGRTLDVHIRRLRLKLHDDPPQLILSVRGVGYKLDCLPLVSPSDIDPQVINGGARLINTQAN